MLISTVLTFTTERKITLPAALGRAVYAEVLSQIGQRDPHVAKAIHAWNGPVPLTCSTLNGARRTSIKATFSPGENYELHITGLVSPVSEMLHSFLLVEPNTIWTIHGHPFELQGATCDPAGHPWAGLTDYETLAAQHLLHPDPPENRVTLNFDSPTGFKSAGMQVPGRARSLLWGEIARPTGFKSAGMQVPVPMPDLLFGSLVDRWNQFSPVPLDEEMRTFARASIAISRYNLHSVPIRYKQDSFHLGGVGEATYTAPRLKGQADRYWLGAMQMLADFALFSGVGVQTTNGMGQVRRIG